jgi:hypothetical protein
MKAFLEFETPEGAAAALRALTALGYAGCETYGPFPLTKDDADAPRGSFPLAVLAFGAGAAALGAAYLVQWYANVRSYPLNIGGRPAHAAPAFIPAAFESICLLAAIALFLGFLLFERLPQLWQPIFEIDGFERASVDRFWIAFDLGSANELPDAVRHDVVPLDPARIVIGGA